MPKINSSVAVASVNESLPLQVNVSSSVGIPARIKIPSINVDAEVDAVGLTSDGALGVPVGPTTTDWFSGGPRPGEAGSAVIDGHFGWKDGIAAAFDNLSELQKSDEIDVEDASGSTTVFVVQELETFGENDVTQSIFYSDDGKAHLNLITCGGVWNALKESYSTRTVVFATEK